MVKGIQIDFKNLDPSIELKGEISFLTSGRQTKNFH